MTTQGKGSITPEQLARIEAFAAVHGRYWKQALSGMWMNGSDAAQRDGHLLRQVRNTLGPQWLRSFKLPTQAQSNAMGEFVQTLRSLGF